MAFNTRINLPKFVAGPTHSKCSLRLLFSKSAYRFCLVSRSVYFTFMYFEDGTLPRDKVRISKGWGGFFKTLPNKKSPKLDLNITVLFTQPPLVPSLGVQQTMDDMMGVIRGIPYWKAVGPDSLAAEVLKLNHPEFIRYFHNLLVNV